MRPDRLTFVRPCITPNRAQREHDRPNRDRADSRRHRMDLIWEAIRDALTLILRADPELIRITALSLVVSGSATAIAALIGIPLGIAIHIGHFRGRGSSPGGDQRRHGPPASRRRPGGNADFVADRPTWCVATVVYPVRHDRSASAGGGAPGGWIHPRGDQPARPGPRS